MFGFYQRLEPFNDFVEKEIFLIEIGSSFFEKQINDQ